MSNRNHLSTAGFTLIELLVIIASLGLLASIGYGSFNNYKQRAYDAAAIAANRDFYQAALARLTDIEQKLGNTCPPFLVEEHIDQPASAPTSTSSALPDSGSILSSYRPGAAVNYHVTIVSNPVIGSTIFVYTYSCKGSIAFTTTRMGKWCTAGSMNLNTETRLVESPLNPALCS